MLAFASVFFKNGRFEAFFKPGQNGVAVDAEDALHRPQRAALMLGGQDFGFALFRVGIAAFVLAAGLAAAVALIALSAVLGAEADQVNTAEVITRNCLRNHATV